MQCPSLAVASAALLDSLSTGGDPERMDRSRAPDPANQDEELVVRSLRRWAAGTPIVWLASVVVVLGLIGWRATSSHHHHRAPSSAASPSEVRSGPNSVAPTPSQRPFSETSCPDSHICQSHEGTPSGALRAVRAVVPGGRDPPRSGPVRCRPDAGSVDIPRTDRDRPRLSVGHHRLDDTKRSAEQRERRGQRVSSQLPLFWAASAVSGDADPEAPRARPSTRRTAVRTPASRGVQAFRLAPRIARAGLRGGHGRPTAAPSPGAVR